MSDMQTAPATTATQAQPEPNDVRELVDKRRQALGIGKEEPLWGLALSGGGIRSATFALGLVTSLAERQLLRRFDMLSTVSGGGYTGSALGKLFHDAGATAVAAGDVGSKGGAEAVERALCDANGSWMVWWLRATSRYLAPRGGKDLLQAGALALRSLIAIHLELAVIFVLIGGGLAGVHFAVWLGLDWYVPVVQPYPELAALLLQPWMSLYWLLIGIPVLVASPSVAGYWAVPSDGIQRTGDGGLMLVFGVFAVVGSIALLYFASWCPGLACKHFQPFAIGVEALLVLIVLGPFVARRCVARERGKLATFANGRVPAEAAVLSAARNRLTRWFTFCLRVAIWLFFVGVVDRLAWWLAMHEGAQSPWITPVALAIGLSLVRFTAARAVGQTSAPALPRGVSMRLVSVGGLLVLVLLCAWWVSLVYRFGLGPIFPGPGVDLAAVRAGRLDFAQSGPVIAACIVVPLTYLLLTMRNWDFSNTSSLHMFYSGRLERSYLGAVNPERFLGAGPLQQVRASEVEAVARRSTVFDVVQGDEIGLHDYAPHRSGGPVHILNVTLNQSYDARGGLYNQDRKGQSLSITSGGLHRLGLTPWRAGSPEMRASGLASWMAISGAAFTPGLGGQTSKGLAALLFMAGVRLGYWWRNPYAKETSHPHGLCKYGLIRHELLGNFGGDGGPCWYLSDGGHFENTGAYALLRERARMIVISDAGADPGYRFDDLENLVRKARIDLGAEIEFLQPVVAGGRHSLHEFLARFGSVADLRDPDGRACLALARVQYGRATANASHGWLVLVKPNIYHGLPVDLVNYKASCPDFPQETTTDQFFSEKQWESYYVLGQELGLELRAELLDGLARDDESWVRCFERDQTALEKVRARPAPQGTEPPRKRRLGTAAASGAGAALLTAMLYAGWQGWDTFRKDGQAHQAEVDRSLVLAAAQYEQLLAGDQHVLPMLKAALADIARRECDREPSTLAGSLHARMFTDVESRCTGDAPSPSCAILRDTVRTSSCLTANFVDPGAPHYWGRPYHRPDLVARARPGPAVIVEVASADKPAAAVVPVVPAMARSSASPTAAIQQAALPAPPKTTAAATCVGHTVYIQRDGGGVEPVDKWKRANADALVGAKVPAVEDVSATAQRRGRVPPKSVPRSIAIYHTASDEACARSLSGVDVEPLAATLRGTPGVVEVWIASGPQ